MQRQHKTTLLKAVREREPVLEPEHEHIMTDNPSTFPPTDKTATTSVPPSLPPTTSKFPPKPLFESPTDFYNLSPTDPPNNPSPSPASPPPQIAQFDIEDPTTPSPFTSYLPTALTSQYFNITLSQFLHRILHTFTPWRRTSFLSPIPPKTPPDQQPQQSQQEESPDLYGPFWLTTTLILSLAVSSNLYELLKNLAYQSEHHPQTSSSLHKYTAVDFENLLQAAVVFYTYVVVVSVIVWLGKKYFKGGDVGESGSRERMGGLVYVGCVYGYSMAPLIPAVVVSSVGNAVVSWISLVVAFGLSGVFVFRNLWTNREGGEEEEVGREDGGSGGTVAVESVGRRHLRFGSVFAHCLLGIVVKFRFF